LAHIHGAGLEPVVAIFEIVHVVLVIIVPFLVPRGRLTRELYIKCSQLCCGTGTGSARIRNFLEDPDPGLEVMDPELGMNLTKIHKKINYLNDIKNTLILPVHFIEKDALK
jgi:hypothetical protein